MRAQPTFDQAKVDKASAELLALPGVGDYAAVAADCPWHHTTYSAKGQTSRSPSHHYPTMSIAELCALPVRDVASRNSHLFLWTTQPHLQVSFKVMEAWNYKFSSVFLFWVKLNPRAVDQMFLSDRDVMRGMGKTTRKSVEILLLGRRGSPKRLRKDLPDFLFAPRREHSRKPDGAYSRIIAYCPGPRLEMFAREPRDGFDVFGNQTDKFAPAVPIRSHETYGPPYPYPTTPLFAAAE